jgi:Zn-dependent peptidase ImmA (M78 family)
MPRIISSTEKGDTLERRVRDLLQAEIDADRFWAKKSNCKVFWRKGYHSKDRGGDIIFDISIEVYLPGAKEYSILVLVECKNYEHPVPVSDVEEFFTKVQQVAASNAKAVVASTASFQSGSRAFAKSKGIALMRCFEASKFKWELRRSASGSARSTSPEEAHLVEAGLSQQDFQSLAFDLYLQSPRRVTNSLWDFFEDMVSESKLAPSEIRKVANSRTKIANQVPFCEKDDLESRGAKILTDLCYSGGVVALESLCGREAKRSGLIVNLQAANPSVATLNPVLGRVQFDPLVIDVYAQDNVNPGRDRFTLAHELAHHLLGHGRYLVRESCDDSDFALQRRALVDGSDVARMEFQANFLAASLLMPRAHFIEDFSRVVRSLDLVDKGFGHLYVDDQLCNLQNYEIVTGHLMRKYGVSRTAAKVRLEAIGLLRDARRSNGIQPLSLGFGMERL